MTTFFSIINVLALGIGYYAMVAISLQLIFTARRAALRGYRASKMKRLGDMEQIDYGLRNLRADLRTLVRWKYVFDRFGYTSRKLLSDIESTTFWIDYLTKYKEQIESTPAQPTPSPTKPTTEIGFQLKRSALVH
jgi:hypothetical protein